MLQRKEGLVPSFVKAKVLQKQPPTSTFSLSTPERATKTGYPSIPAHIRAYIEEADNQESISNSVEMINAKPLRNFYGAIVTIEQSVQGQKLTPEEVEAKIDEAIKKDKKDESNVTEGEKKDKEYVDLSITLPTRPIT